MSMTLALGISGLGMLCIVSRISNCLFPTYSLSLFPHDKMWQDSQGSAPAWGPRKSEVERDFSNYAIGILGVGYV